MVALITSAVVYCSDVATLCYNYGTKVSKGISELMETGGISPGTMEEVREAETQAKISLFFGILGAGTIDSCLAKMTTAKGVAAGRNPDIWGKISGNSEKINNMGMEHIEDILNVSGEFKIVESNGHTFLEKMLSDGKGIRLNMDGTFKGFIDQIR